MRQDFKLCVNYPFKKQTCVSTIDIINIINGK